MSNSRGDSTIRAVRATKKSKNRFMSSPRPYGFAGHDGAVVGGKIGHIHVPIAPVKRQSVQRANALIVDKCLAVEDLKAQRLERREVLTFLSRLVKWIRFCPMTRHVRSEISEN